jgi:zinc and cadmium transporter
VLTRWVPTLVSIAVGALLAAAFLDLLPEAFRRSADVPGLFGTVLAGIVVLFALEKLALWRHHHGHDGADPRQRAAVLILVGDGVHNFVDGVLIAAAFLTDPAVGVVTTLAVIAHELPQEVGDFMVLLNAGLSRTQALALNLAASLTAVAGGLVGYLLLDTATLAIPYVLALAAASFIYVAVADLIPDLHRQHSRTPAAAQVALLAAGVAIVFAGQGLLH